MTNKNYFRLILFHASSIYARDILVVLLNFFTGVILARKLGPEMLGVWFLLLSLNSSLDAFGRTKAEIASVYFSGKFQIKTSDIIVNLNFITLISLLLLFLLAWLNFDRIYWYLFSNASGDYRPHLMLVIASLIVSFFSTNYFYFFLGEQKFALYNKIVFLQGTTNFLLVILFIYIFKIGLWSPALSLFLSWTISLSISLYKKHKPSEQQNGHLSWHTCKLLLKGGFSFYISGLLQMLQDQSPKLITLSFLTFSQLAMLAQAQIIFSLLLKIPNAINTVVYPVLGKLNQENLVKTALFSFKICFILMVFVVIIFFFVIEKLIILAFGIEYIGTADFLFFLAPSIIFLGPAIILCSSFNGMGLFHISPILQLAPVTALLLCIYFFSPTLGANSILQFMSLANIVFALITVFWFIRKFNLTLNHLIPSYKDLSLLKKLKR